MNDQISAMDLTQRPPRSPRSRLGNLVILPRVLDKGRATLAGKNGSYEFGASTDKHLVRFLQLDLDGLLKELASGKGDGEMLQWVLANSKAFRAPYEIESWSAFMDKRGPDSDQETLDFFRNYVGKLSTTREDIKTWFDALELDDHVTFGGKA